MYVQTITIRSIDRLMSLVLVLSLALAGLTAGMGAPNAPAISLPKLPAVEHSTAPAELQAGEWSSIQSQIRQAEYQITWHEASAEQPQPYYWAPNQAQGWGLVFTPQGLELTPAGEGGDWSWGLSLLGYGYDQLRAPVQAPEIVVKAQRLSYRLSENLTEWYLNTPDGLEHGFSLA